MQVLGEEDPETISLLNLLADCLKQQGRHSEAVPLYYQELAACQKVGGSSYRS